MHRGDVGMAADADEDFVTVMRRHVFILSMNKRECDEVFQSGMWVTSCCRCCCYVNGSSSSAAISSAAESWMNAG